MGFSHRTVLIDKYDHLCRLADTKFTAMLQNPRSHCFPQFATQRVRMASAFVELLDRQPIQIVRMTFDILTFDYVGRLDADIFCRQQASRAEVSMGSLLAAYSYRNPDTSVIDAAAKFVAQGGRWTPSPDLARAIEDAALGRSRCPRL